MAVVIKYGTGYKDPAAVNVISALYAEGTRKNVTSIVAIANGDSATSQLFVGRVPSNALIKSDSQIITDAITTATVNLGFTTGIAGANTVLAAAAPLGTAGAALLRDVGYARTNMGKPAWQLAGLTSDPGGMLDIVAVLAAGAAAGGNVIFDIDYVKVT